MSYIDKKHLTLIAMLIFLSFLGLFWLCIVVLIVALVYRGVNYIKHKFIRKTANVLFSFLMLLFLAIGVRVFIVDIYLIPSSSMENTLYPKDVILVNKLKYGPNLPRSPYEIPWLNLFYFLQDNSKEAVTEKIWPAKRLTGTSEIKQGDVVVFKNFRKDVVLVKRCAAIAGDTLKIIDGEVYTNKVHYRAPSHIRNTYAFKVNTPKWFYRAIDSLHINSSVYGINKDSDWKEAELSYLEMETLKDLNLIDSVQKSPEAYILNKRKLYGRGGENQAWTLDNYGPVVVPKAGMEIRLTNETFRLYRGVIKHNEGVFIKRDKNNIFKVKGKPITSYTFKKNYYFMLGDNRKQSRDSRYFGFLPEEKIIGKATCILFSNKDDRFQWSRSFKSI
ncbi:signal peptidase I [Seonamhaeicola sp. NFXS20]|uniref:signal peptidase I n=1 Tax=Seonamhaeicola sp. NFXS20 TaxID=2816959 RepID=UPI003B8CD189